MSRVAEKFASLEPGQAMALASPYEELRGFTSTDDLLSAAEIFYALLVKLLDGDYGFDSDPVEYKCATCTKLHSYDRRAALNRLLMIIGDFYSYTAHRIIHAEPQRALDIAGCSPEEYTSLKSGEGSTDVEWSRELLTNFIGVLQASGGLYLLRRGDVAGEAHIDAYEGILSASSLGVYHVFQSVVTPQGDCTLGMEAAFLIRKMLSYTLHLQEVIYRWPMRPWSETHESGAFSSLRLPELQLLATRADAVKARYGDRKVEKVFEQQLALLIQSLGFYVVSTRTGESTVDLVCISADPASPFTFLLEAKSSSRPYTLPSDDRRALLQYVEDVKSNLTTSPPLAFVLVVGGAPQRTLKSKIDELEIAANVPVRFCTAQSLANLRENLIGPNPAGIIKKAILRSDKVITDEDLQKVTREVLGRIKRKKSWSDPFFLDQPEVPRLEIIVGSSSTGPVSGRPRTPVLWPYTPPVDPRQVCDLRGVDFQSGPAEELGDVNDVVGQTEDLAVHTYAPATCRRRRVDDHANRS
jgi:hypothetical protein